MKQSEATKLAWFGAVSSLACTPAIDMPPMLPRPEVASIASHLPATASRALDVIPAEGESRSVTVATGDGEQPAQYMSPIHVVASASAAPPARGLTTHGQPVASRSITSYAFGESEPVLTCTKIDQEQFGVDVRSDLWRHGQANVGHRREG